MNRKKLINLLNEISFESEKKRREWIKLADFMDENELNEVYRHFKNRKAKEKEIKLKLIIKYSLENEYMEGIENLSKIVINKNK